MATQLYECAIILNELRDTARNIIEPAELIKEPFYLLAGSQDQATLVAGRSVPVEITDDPKKFDRVVVIVRPF